MSSVSTIFYTLLSESAETTGIVGANIYPLQAPQGTPFPFIVFHQVSNNPTNTKAGDGASTMDIIRMQVTMITDFNSGKPLLDNLASYVRSALDYQFMKVIAGTFVYNISFQGEYEAFDEGSSQDGVYLKYQDYLITIKR